MGKGRPTKYTPETVKRFTDALRVGATYRLACDYAGITEDTFANWRKRYSDFSDAIKEAEGTAAVGWLAKIEKAANEGTWQAAAWKLERRYPESYGRTITSNTNTNTNIDLNWDEVPPDLRDAFVERRMSLDDVLRELQQRTART